MIDLCDEQMSILERFGYMSEMLLRQEIARLVMERNWQQKDFAEACKLSPTTVSRTLRGDMPISKENALIYARVLNLDPEETVRRALVETKFPEMEKEYREYPTIVRLFRAISTLSVLPGIYEYEEIE